MTFPVQGGPLNPGPLFGEISRGLNHADSAQAFKAAYKN